MIMGGGNPGGNAKHLGEQASRLLRARSDAHAWGRNMLKRKRVPHDECERQGFAEDEGITS